jgi:hypothetical protein
LEVIEGKIVLLGRKADLEAQLEREFPDLNGLDYLIQMPISSLTSEKRDALVADVVAEELEVLVNTTAVGMWMRTGRTSYRALEGRGLSLCAILTYSR